MEHSSGKTDAGMPLVEERELACVLTSAVRVMAAAGLWQDLREGLDQAETICRDLRRRDIAPAWWARAYRQEGRPGTTVPGIEILLWWTAPGAPCTQGGERP